MNVVEAVPGGRGLGVVYWEPAWTAVNGSGWDPRDPSSGNAWENQRSSGTTRDCCPPRGGSRTGRTGVGTSAGRHIPWWP